jgi:hypothetical protein
MTAVFRLDLILAFPRLGGLSFAPSPTVELAC